MVAEVLKIHSPSQPGRCLGAELHSNVRIFSKAYQAPGAVLILVEMQGHLSRAVESARALHPKGPKWHSWTATFFLSSPEDMLIDFRERGREGGGRRETSIGSLSYALQEGTEPAILASALTGNQTRDLLVHRMMFQSTEPHQLGPGSVT